MIRNVDRTSELARTEERNHGFHCITCSDEAVEMVVLRVDAERSLALCEDGEGARASVEIALVDGVASGDTLLVHAGTALVRA